MTGILLRRMAFWGPVTLMLVLACTPGISFIEDLGRHLLLGRIIIETGAVPHTNLLTWTYPDFPVINHHWFFQVLAALVYDNLGYQTLIVTKMLVMAVALALVLKVALHRLPAARSANSAGAAVIWGTGMLAAVVLGYRAHIRPELISFLCLAGLLALGEPLRGGESTGRWVVMHRMALLAVMVLWVNSHIYFMFGLGVLAALALERWLITPTRRVAIVEGTWWLVAVAVCCLNPRGLDGLLYPLRIMDNYGVSVTENLPPLALAEVGACPMLLTLPWLAALVAIATLMIAIHGVRSWVTLSPVDRPAAMAASRPADVIIAAAALLASALMARHAVLLALTAPLVVATAMNLPWSVVLRPRHGLAPYLIGFTGVMILLNAGLVWSVVEGSYARRFPAPLAPTPFGFDDPARYREPSLLVRTYNLRGPVYSDFNVGSLVEWNLYPQPGYVDNRPEAFPLTFWHDEVNPSRQDPLQWQELSKRRGFTMVIQSTWDNRFPLPFPPEEHPEWALVHLDEFMAVWLRRTPANAPAIRDLGWSTQRLLNHVRNASEDLLALPGTPWWRRTALAERVLFRLHGAALAGGVEQALPYLEQLVRFYPDYCMARNVLGNAMKAVSKGPAP